MDCDFEEKELIEQWLSEAAEKNVNIIIPVKSEPKKLIDMCLNNAADNLTAKVERSGKEMSALNELGTILGLSSPPRYIEAYDISNTAGSENVAGMIVFKDARPQKNLYRKFKIKSFAGQDDFRSLAEVLERRLNEYKKGEDEAFSRLPDLILLDGGKGQISAVKPVIERLGYDIALFGMVKDSKHKTRAITDGKGEIVIKANRSVFTLVTAIQDEVHRYAISFHQKRRSKSMLNSEILKINGIGESKAKLLLKYFKTLKAIKSASVEELKKAPKISDKNAQDIYKFFNS